MEIHIPFFEKFLRLSQYTLKKGIDKKSEDGRSLPGDGKELLPPPRCDEGDVEAENEGERDQSEERVEISHHTLEKPGEAS